MELECGYSPKQSQSYLFGSPYQHWPGKVAVGNLSLGKNTAVRRSCFLPHSTDIDINYYTHTHICTHFPSPHPSPPPLLNRQPDRRSVASAENGCGTGRLPGGAGFPCCNSRVSMVYVLLLRCFSCSHTVLPKEHSLGVIFFLLTFLLLCCNFLQFPVFLSCLPPCHMYVMYGQVDG